MSEPKSEILKYASLAQAVRLFAFSLDPLKEQLEEIHGYPTVRGDLFISPTPDKPLHFDSADPLRKGARAVLNLLATNQLIATGCKLILRKVKDPVADGCEEDAYFPDPVMDDFFFGNIIPADLLRAKVPIDFWSLLGVNWAESFVWSDGLCNEITRQSSYEKQTVVAYSKVTIPTDNLMECFYEMNGRQNRTNHTVPWESEGTRPSSRSPFLDLMLRAEAHFGERLLVAKKSEIEDWLAVEGPKIDPRWTTNKRKSMASYIRPLELERGGNRKSRS